MHHTDIAYGVSTWSRNKRSYPCRQPITHRESRWASILPYNKHACSSPTHGLYITLIAELNKLFTSVFFLMVQHIRRNLISFSENALKDPGLYPGSLFERGVMHEKRALLSPQNSVVSSSLDRPMNFSPILELPLYTPFFIEYEIANDLCYQLYPMKFY